MKKILYFLPLLFALTIISCKNNSNDKTDKNFALGADISWITQIENLNKYHFVNDKNIEMDGFRLVKDCGINMIRLRVWKNPKPDYLDSLVWCDSKDFITKAIRAKELGMDIMLDFHYSDHWADPGKQVVPNSWKDCDINSLCDSLKNYTLELLTTLKKQNITPKWIQIGNETPSGFIKPLGDAVEHPENFARLFKTAYQASKEIFPDAICILHIDNGFDLDRSRFIIDILKKNNVDFDMMGLSLYPMMNWIEDHAEFNSNWKDKTLQCLNNCDSIWNIYQRQTMIVEIGGPTDHEEECKQMIEYIIENKSENCKGLIWWEPLTIPELRYTMGAVNKINDSTFTPNAALKAFRKTK